MHSKLKVLRFVSILGSISPGWMRGCDTATSRRTATGWDGCERKATRNDLPAFPKARPGLYLFADVQSCKILVLLHSNNCMPHLH